MTCAVECRHRLSLIWTRLLLLNKREKSPVLWLTRHFPIEGLIFEGTLLISLWEFTRLLPLKQLFDSTRLDTATAKISF